MVRALVSKAASMPLDAAAAPPATTASDMTGVSQRTREGTASGVCV